MVESFECRLFVSVSVSDAVNLAPERVCVRLCEDDRGKELAVAEVNPILCLAVI